mgnify:CR=1 FL=1
MEWLFFASCRVWRCGFTLYSQSTFTTFIICSACFSNLSPAVKWFIFASGTILGCRSIVDNLPAFWALINIHRLPPFGFLFFILTHSTDNHCLLFLIALAMSANAPQVWDVFFFAEKASVAKAGKKCCVPGRAKWGTQNGVILAVTWWTECFLTKISCPLFKPKHTDARRLFTFLMLLF